jgi:pimeloyl-ACP methyl ester carboxylesterase
MQLRFTDEGVGSAVMLLHGGPSSVADFDPVVAALRDDHRVLVPWLPGYGPSPRLDGDYSFARVYELIEQALHLRGVGEVAIVGVSQGAHHALALASSTRVRVTRLVCLAGYAALTPADREAMIGFAAMVSAPGASLLAPEVREMARQRFLAPAFGSEPHAIAGIERWLAATTAAVLADELRAVVQADLRDSLPELAIPVVARVGTLDVACPPAYSEEIVRLCPHGRLELVDGHGHALLLEQPDATTAAIRAALV